ncbi:MAG: hypothetical protein J0H83_10895 [Candidatus Melainabacteria bacterium]|nr:hypothetical protein [Candidatus Melainabacteria bacterium]
MPDFLHQFFVRESRDRQDQTLINQDQDKDIDELKSRLDEISQQLAMAVRAHALQYIESLQKAHPSLHLEITTADTLIEKQAQSKKSKKSTSHTYFRFQIIGRDNLLSFRSAGGLLEYFSLPIQARPNTQKQDPSQIATFANEYGSRYKGCFNYVDLGEGFVWRFDKGQELDAEQAKHIIQALIDELVVAESRHHAQSHSQTSHGGNSLQDLAAAPDPDRANLLFRLVNQEEVLKMSLARDLHDSVIADLMMLKRYLSGDKALSTEETIEIIDETLVQLRDLVNSYSPRQLQEWGLRVGLQDLLDRLGRRTGIATSMIIKGEMPLFPESVTLHIFRIVQEALNNAEKHARAAHIDLEIKVDRETATNQDGDLDRVLITVEDDGEGFELEQDRVGSGADSLHHFGMGGMQERVELIKCFYPCHFAIESSIKQGTRVTLQIQKRRV